AHRRGMPGGLVKDDHLFFNVADDSIEKLFAWPSPLIGEVIEGRIGLRHMWMKSARYKTLPFRFWRTSPMQSML
ncbi:MAG: hypothetical protein KAG66_20725, partial [Methylococcales bacterium]|nr:hypothetical protein [Methylococcales bacterium]